MCTPETILAKLSGGRNIDRLDKMVWVGRNYSIADLKADLCELCEVFKQEPYQS